jgi:hypothetical protein
LPIALAVPDIEIRGNRNLDADLKFCRRALSRSNSLAMQGQLESATRDVWVIADSADSVRNILAKVEDAEQLGRSNRQLAEVQRGLNDLRMYLAIPREAG